MQQHCRIKLGYFISPPETQLWNFCLCSGHSILVNFSETSHVTVISLDVLYRAHSGLYRDKCFCKPSHTSLKMAIFNLLKNCTSLWKYDYILLFLLHLNNFLNHLFVIKQHLRKMLWVFKFKYDFLL